MDRDPKSGRELMTVRAPKPRSITATGILQPTYLNDINHVCRNLPGVEVPHSKSKPLHYNGPRFKVRSTFMSRTRLLRCSFTAVRLPSNETQSEKRAESDPTARAPQQRFHRGHGNLAGYITATTSSARSNPSRTSYDSCITMISLFE